jgi:hypothetical protein
MHKLCIREKKPVIVLDAKVLTKSRAWPERLASQGTHLLGVVGAVISNL